jgi:site-specific recombinase XerD
MENRLKKLIQLCEQELTSREYGFVRHKHLSKAWGELLEWLTGRGYTEFNANIGFQYCEETFGTSTMSGIDKDDQLRLRAVRMLISYQRDGDFEFRTPSVVKSFIGQTGEEMEDYLHYLRDAISLTENTISNKRHYLLSFNAYLESCQVLLENIGVDTLEGFYAFQKYSLASKHNCNSTLRLFLRHAYDNGITTRDCSLNILPDNYRKQCKLPTTYEAEEIKSMLEAVDRASSIGKRDYLVLLLASEYGWRSSDIVNFSFGQVDWDKNMITFSQQKTGVPVAYQLLSSIGNAIIDYLKHGRPVTDAPQIIVAHESSKKGKKLSAETIHSIVTKHMRAANISNWRQKKHGPHSLRHSLASNLLKKNISIPVISTVLGHQSTESTKVYLSVDNARLKQCALPIPTLRAAVYEEV